MWTRICGRRWGPSVVGSENRHRIDESSPVKAFSRNTERSFGGSLHAARNSSETLLCRSGVVIGAYLQSLSIMRTSASRELASRSARLAAKIELPPSQGW